MDKKYQLLRERFGYSSFRPGQEALVDALLGGRDVLGVMPTGAGKSLCYQLPALTLPGLTIVISPLIALMHDQVDALRRRGIPACSIDSSLSATQQAQAFHAVSAGQVKLLYLAPERLVQQEFWNFAHRLSISLLVVDEAHCISHWGHDFRPPYRGIIRFLNRLPRRPIVAAFTATATRTVRQDIVDSLALCDPKQVVTSFDRPNLFFEVRRPANREQELLLFLRQHANQSGILYCLTRKRVEELYSVLQDNDIRCVRYHAGLPTAIRQDSQQRFVSDDARIMVATNAFGMGIDKANVAFVVHFGMPADLESYYQEAGRAGRNGKSAHCMLLFDESDLNLHQFFLTRDPDNPLLTESEVKLLRRGQFSRLRAMRDYALSETCLRKRLLSYFGEAAPDFCEQCSICHAASVERDMSTEAQKILSCVYRTQEQANLDELCRILHGSHDLDLLHRGWNTLSTYGLLSDALESEIRAMAGHVLRAGYMKADESGCLHLCASAKAVLFHGARVSHRVRIAHANIRANRSAALSGAPELYLQLDSERKHLAQLRGIPAHLVCSDQTLIALARALPDDQRALCTIPGMDDARIARYGSRFLQAIARYRQAHGG